MEEDLNKIKDALKETDKTLKQVIDELVPLYDVDIITTKIIEPPIKTPLEKKKVKVYFYDGGKEPTVLSAVLDRVTISWCFFTVDVCQYVVPSHRIIKIVGIEKGEF